MQKYYTTSTAPGFSWQFTDPSGNILSLTNATFKQIYRCTKNFLKVQGSGSFSGTSQQLQNGQVLYTLSATDMANAYALYSSLIGCALFEVFATAIIAGQEYDALPVVIQIEKI